MGLINSENVKVTILTPTYNRAYILPQLYNSLLRQSDKRFRWVIVDDGSIDNTKEIVDKFETTDFSITYIYKENGGKHTAINKGVQLIDTEYTFIVDSDDFLINNAIECVNQWIHDIDGVKGFAGVSGVSIDTSKEHKTIGEFPSGCKYIDCLNSERRKKKLMGDKAEIYKTELLKQNPFPEYKGEFFMPESVIWNKFSLMGLKVRWYKEEIKVCEYLEDGLTSSTKKQSHFEDNFNGYKDDCEMSLKILPFPYNYSAASVFWAKCYAWKKYEGCLDDFNITQFQKRIIKVLGRLRYQMGRY